MKPSDEVPSFCQRVSVRVLWVWGLGVGTAPSWAYNPSVSLSLLFGFILWEVALHSDSDYKGFYESWISALAVLILQCVSHSPRWGLSSPYFVQPLSNADKIPPSHKDSRRKQRQRARASGDKHCSLPWTPCFETLAKLTEVIVVIWLNNKIHIQPISQKCSQQCRILLFLLP